ncbi:MAG: hypothetical protein FWG70_01635 [Oscillospiraceae bacterium]|nr:hypothetical protein [Oscillospiraceae bacterium]
MCRCRYSKLFPVIVTILFLSSCSINFFGTTEKKEIKDLGSMFVESPHDKIFIIPVLTEEYGEYVITREKETSAYFYYIKSAELKKRYGEEGYVQISISKSTVYNENELSLDDYVKEAREHFIGDTFGSAEKDGTRFEYHFWSGLNVLGKPYSSAIIMTIYEDVYHINIRTPHGEEEDILSFIDNLRFEEVVVGDSGLPSESNITVEGTGD